MDTKCFNGRDGSRRRTQAVLWACGGLWFVASFASAQDVTTLRDETALRQILRGGVPADQALACKRLAIYGSAASVADLAPLLANEQLASWARIALEAIPGSEADAALRDAATKLEGRLLIGTLHSIGVRRDSSAVPLLATRFQGDDPAIAAAAAYALGRVGDDAAAQALRAGLDAAQAEVRSAAAEGCVACAELRLAAGQPLAAIELYEAVSRADVPPQRKFEAGRGLVLSQVAAGQELAGLAKLQELLRSDERDSLPLALGLIREFPGNAIDRPLGQEVVNLPPERGELLIKALADRHETVDRASLAQAARSGPGTVRLAAIEALGRVGDAASVPALLDLASDPEGPVAVAARAALAQLPDPQADREILQALPAASGPRLVALLELAGARRLAAGETLEKALDSSDADVRKAALTALGETIPAERMNLLITQVLSPKHSEDLPPATAALKTAAVRMPDREACSVQVAAALPRAKSPETKIALLEILGAVGGRKALDALHAAAQADNPQLQDASTRLLGEWMTVDAAPVLLDLAQTAAGAKYKTRALRGYIRLARQFTMPDAQRVEMCRNAWNAADQLAEKKLVLQVLERYPLPGTLELAVQAAQIAELKEEATPVALRIAQQLGTEPQKIGELLQQLGLPSVDLEIVAADYGAGNQRQDVTPAIKARATNSQMIVLGSPNYNAAFGGDPAPGTPKQLKIKYRLNGKDGEAAFAENAFIFLPVPK